MTWLIMFLGILLILAGIVAGKTVSSYAVEVNGPFGMGKITATQKKVDSEKMKPMTASDIERLKKAIKISEIAYTSEKKSFLQGNRKSIETNIMGTNTVYSKFSKIQLAGGSFFTERAEKENSRVAVIDQKLAVKLFNTVEAVGNEITVFEENFSVIGVISTDSSIINGLIDDGIPDIYIPASTFFELNKNAAITHIEIKSPFSDTLGNNSKLVIKGMEAINRNPDNYSIIDFNIEQAGINNRSGMLIFLYGIITILLAVFYIKREISSILGLIIKEAKIEYFSGVLKKKLTVLSLLLAKTIAVAGFIILVWNLIKFNCYIPPELIPADLTDVGYFKELLHNTIINGNANPAYTVSKSVKVLNISEKITNVSFIASLFPGLVFFYAGLKQARVLKTDIFRLLLQLAILFLVALFILAGTVIYFKLPLTLTLSSLTVIWVFICANSVKPEEPSEREVYSSVN
jgi:hypothetical protein